MKNSYVKEPGAAIVPPKSCFASDNTAGVCPEAWSAMERANRDYAPSYGEDEYTTRAADLMREIFEIECEVFFVFNGTAANSLAMAACCQSYHSIICHESAHVLTDECGAPEFFSNGTKLHGVPGDHGKITPKSITQVAQMRSDIHFPKPRAISLTQATECGTLYQLAELDAIHETAQRLELILQMDGARFGNAVAALGVAPKIITWRAGVDVLCFGGTKLGMAGCEAVIFFNRDLAREFDYRCKQAGQLASKMRFLTAGWVGMLENGAWLTYARHANRHAALLGERLANQAGLPGIHPVEANAVFVSMAPALLQGLRAKGWRLNNTIGGGVRLMCSWRTTEAEIDALIADARELQKAA